MKKGTCNRCGSAVVFNRHLVSEGYDAWCPDHDEDLYNIEIDMVDDEEEDEVFFTSGQVEQIIETLLEIYKH